jgi:GNAT superfamily N-acetyltransferase
MNRIRLAESASDWRRCYPVMSELRTHLTEREFLERARRQRRECGWRLAYVEERDTVCAVAGYRVTRSLSWGKFLYVDDLVTAAAARSRGHGKTLFDWLVAQARAAGCDELHLDSGVQRFGAHRFYLARRMDITCHHFALKLR